MLDYTYIARVRHTGVERPYERAIGHIQRCLYKCRSPIYTCNQASRGYVRCIARRHLVASSDVSTDAVLWEQNPTSNSVESPLQRPRFPFPGVWAFFIYGRRPVCEMSQTTVADGGEQYRQPNQETWYVQKITEDRNDVVIAPEARTANRGRAKTLDKRVYVNGCALGKIDTRGLAKHTLEYRQQTDGVDTKTAFEKRGDTDWSDVEEGFPIYKTAEDEDALYFLTSKPGGYRHESADPEKHASPYVDDTSEDEQPVGERVQQLNSMSYPTPIRLGPGTPLDAIEWGQTYDAEVNNTREDFGVFVSLPDTNTPDEVTGLVKKDSQYVEEYEKLDKLKSPAERNDGKGDSLVVAPCYRRVEDGKWGFTIVDALDTHAKVDFDNPVPQEPRYVKNNGEVVEESLARATLGLTDDDDEDEAEPAKAQNPMSASPHQFVSARKKTEADSDTENESDSMQAAASNDDDEEQSKDSYTKKAEKMPKKGSLEEAYMEHLPVRDANEYTDVGEFVDDDEVTLEDVEPDLTKQYADASLLNESRDELFWCLRQVLGEELDAAEFIRLKLASLDDDEIRDFIRVAASSELPDEVFRKLTRELA